MTAIVGCVCAINSGDDGKEGNRSAVGLRLSPCLTGSLMAESPIQTVVEVGPGDGEVADR